MPSSSVVPLASRAPFTPDQVRLNSCATALVSQAIRDVPSAMASVFDALGTVQSVLGSEYVVYAKGGLCLVLAAMAVAKCMGTCEEADQINEFLSAQMSSGVLSPSDVDTTIMKRCQVHKDKPTMLMGIPVEDDANVIYAAKEAIKGLNQALSKNRDFWNALDGIISKAKYPYLEISSYCTDTEVYSCDENGVEDCETTFAKIVSTESQTPPLLRSLNSTLKVVAGFTLVRSKLHMFEEEFMDCEETGVQSGEDDDEQWFDASETAIESGGTKSAVAEILDISWKDGKRYLCDMDMTDLMPLEVELENQTRGHTIFMMTIPALVKDLLFCLMSTPEQKSTKRVLRIALACAIADDALSIAVREYLVSSNKNGIPLEFMEVFDFEQEGNASKKTLFISMINKLEMNLIKQCIDQGTYIRNCMKKSGKPKCLSDGLNIKFSKANTVVSSLDIGQSRKDNKAESIALGGYSRKDMGWSLAASAAAALAVTLASSLAGAVRN